jgi:hypothetical protein
MFVVLAGREWFATRGADEVLGMVVPAKGGDDVALFDLLVTVSTRVAELIVKAVVAEEVPLAVMEFLDALQIGTAGPAGEVSTMKLEIAHANELRCRNRAAAA